MASTALVVASPADPAHGGAPGLTSPGLTRTGRKSGPPERLGMVAMGSAWGDEDDEEAADDEEVEEESADEQAPSAAGPAKKRGRGCGHAHSNVNKNTGKKTAYCAPCLTTRFHSNLVVATNRLPELDPQFVVDNAVAMQKRLADSIQRARDLLAEAKAKAEAKAQAEAVAKAKAQAAQAATLAEQASRAAMDAARQALEQAERNHAAAARQAQQLAAEAAAAAVVMQAD
jgi:hypothetical protein